MSAHNEDNKSQHPLPGVSAEYPTFDWGESPLGEATAARSAAEAARSQEVKQRLIDAASKDLTHAGKVARTVGRKELKQAQTKEQSLSEAQVKPARSKGAKVQTTGNVNDQTGTVSRPKRASTRKRAKTADASGQTTLIASDTPPITPAVIEFLGKQDATAADVRKLDPDSLAFVQRHFNHMQRLEADSQLMSAYLAANARPVSPALQKFADALIKYGRRQPDQVTPQASTEVPEPIKQQTAFGQALSFGHKATVGPAYAPVVVQLRKLVITSSKTEVQAQAIESVQDDNKRARKVVGTADILMSLPSNSLGKKDAADLAAGDIEEVRSIKNATARHVALNAMVESGLAQPRYKAEFEAQAPDLVGSAAQAYKVMKADWVLAYKVSSTLSYVAESSEPLTKDAVITLVKNTIEAIQAIKGDQHRQEALSFSHQIGHWQPLYKEEFARQAPELVALAQAAYKTEEAKAKRVERNVQEVENSIERSPVQLVMDTQQTPPATQVATSKHTTTADQDPVAERLSAEQRAAAPALSAEKTASMFVLRSNLGRRLLLAIGGAAQRAGAWLVEQGRDSQAPTSNAPVLFDKPVASTNALVSAKAVNDNSTLVPEAVARRFLKVEHEYYFPDRTPAFSDRGDKLATRGTNPEVVRSLVEIAQARGWDTVTVKGTEEFRRSAWMEAAQIGLTMVGYKPTALDLAELASRPASNTVEKSVTKERNTTRVQRSAQPAVTQSTSVPTPVAASKTPAPGAWQPDLELAEKAKAFQENKPAFVVKKYPDLAAAYGVVTAAKAFAAEKLPEGAREEFIEMARRHVTQKIASGEQIKGPKIYLAPTRITEVGDPTRTDQTTADMGKSAREKAVEKER